MSRTFISIGGGGPRIGVVLGRRDMARFVAILAIPFGALALFGGATDQYGNALGIVAASALIARLWFAWTRPPGKGPLFHPRPALDTEPQIDRIDSLRFK
jgi:hypothetical protein